MEPYHKTVEELIAEECEDQLYIQNWHKRNKMRYEDLTPGRKNNFAKYKRLEKRQIFSYFVPKNFNEQDVIVATDATRSDCDVTRNAGFLQLPEGERGNLVVAVNKRSVAKYIYDRMQLPITDKARHWLNNYMDVDSFTTAKEIFLKAYAENKLFIPAVKNHPVYTQKVDILGKIIVAVLVNKMPLTTLHGVWCLCGKHHTMRTTEHATRDDLYGLFCRSLYRRLPVLCVTHVDAYEEFMQLQILYLHKLLGLPIAQYIRPEYKFR